MPILVKGVISAEDARMVVQNGAAGIIVSNHGARQLDYVPATIMALEEVVKGAQGRIPVFLDGGVRRGTDVFKALALGASGIFSTSPSPQKRSGGALHISSAAALPQATTMTSTGGVLLLELLIPAALLLSFCSTSPASPTGGAAPSHVRPPALSVGG